MLNVNRKVYYPIKSGQIPVNATFGSFFIRSSMKKKFVSKNSKSGWKTLIHNRELSKTQIFFFNVYCIVAIKLIFMLFFFFFFLLGLRS